MFFKISALHVYSHEDSGFEPIESCKICDLALENQNVEHLFLDSFSFESPNKIIFNNEAFGILPQINASTSLYFRLFGRPPPTIS